MHFDFIVVLNVRIVVLLPVTYQTALRHIQGGRCDNLKSRNCVVWCGTTLPSSLNVVVPNRLQIPEHLHVVMVCAERNDGLIFIPFLVIGTILHAGKWNFDDVHLHSKLHLLY